MDAPALTPDQEHQIAQAKAYLMKADPEGRNLYDHLQDMMMEMLEENPNDVVHHPERFADFSAKVKASRFAYGESSASAGAAPRSHHTVSARAKETMKLFQKPAPEVVTTVEKPTPLTTVTTTVVKPRVAPAFKSIAAENKYWRHCGVGLPEQEAFLLDQSISKLAAEKKLEEVRFFGKIFGTQANYLVVTSRRYVAEGEEVFEEINTMPKPPRKKVEVDIQPEPAYKGCNRLSFWVAPHCAAPWTLLPDVTPQQIQGARKARKLFTGDLDAPVDCYPAFDGTERNYLRAQLSRILSATAVAPQGALEAHQPEEEEEAEEEEEGAAKKRKPAKYHPLTAVNKEFAPDEEAGVAAMADLEQWQHAESHIYKSTGRHTKVPPKPEVEGEEEEVPPEEEEEEEPKEEEEEKELFGALKQDALFAVIDLPKEPNPEDEEEEVAEEEEPPEEGEEEKEEDENKELFDADIADDEPLKKKIGAWTARVTNNTYKKHGVCIVKSLRWPGAVAFAANQGKAWGAVYFGSGTKKTDYAFTPVPAEKIEKEAPDMLEAADATAANEKLVLRGEEPKEVESEDEKEDDEAEEEEDA